MNMIQYAKRYVGDQLKNDVIEKSDIHNVLIREEIDNGVILLCGISATELAKRLPRVDGISFSQYTHYQLIMSFKNFAGNINKQIVNKTMTKKRGRKPKPINLHTDTVATIRQMFNNGKKISEIARKTNLKYYIVRKYVMENLKGVNNE